MHKDRLTFASLCGGALQERIDRAMKRAAENIVDPNTDPSKPRTITVKVKMKPNPDDPEDVEVSAEVSTQLAPELGVKTSLFINKNLQTGDVKIIEHQRGEIKGQLDFSDIETEEEPIEEAQNEVIDFRRAQEG